MNGDVVHVGRGPLLRCVLCHAALGPTPAPPCEACGTLVHADCLRDLGQGRCPTRGCVRAGVPDRLREKEPRPSRAWLAVGLGAAAIVALLGGNELRARAAFEELRGWEEEGSFNAGRTSTVAELRARAARLRDAPWGITVDRTKLEGMAAQLEHLADALERRVEDERRSRADVRR